MTNHHDPARIYRIGVMPRHRILFRDNHQRFCYLKIFVPRFSATSRWQLLAPCSMCRVLDLSLSEQAERSTERFAQSTQKHLLKNASNHFYPHTICTVKYAIRVDILYKYRCTNGATLLPSIVLLSIQIMVIAWQHY